jgi:hypothetical protein
MTPCILISTNVWAKLTASRFIRSTEVAGFSEKLIHVCQTIRRYEWIRYVTAENNEVGRTKHINLQKVCNVPFNNLFLINSIHSSITGFATAPEKRLSWGFTWFTNLSNLVVYIYIYGYIYAYVIIWAQLHLTINITKFSHRFHGN